ncbi:MAG: SH3 domain-containing protein, partial [bacterium]|nr:SH3 domain-containing protein [bacterium]
REALKTMVKEKHRMSSLALYLLGDLSFIENNLDDAKKYYQEARQELKGRMEKKTQDNMIIGLGNFSGERLENVRFNLDRKMKLIEKMLGYRRNFVNRNFAIINGERVRIRKNPVITRNNVVTSLNYGDKVILLSRGPEREKVEGDENYWYQIQLMDNTTGWVFGQYLIFFTY